MTDYRVVVDKSTVPVGTADRVRAAIAEELDERGVEVPFSVVSNPEFLKEGAAVEDFMKPGPHRGRQPTTSARRSSCAQLYAPFQRNHERMLVMDVRSAELTKYAANAMLATRISFMNELANLAEQLGANIEQVRRGIGSDPRIGYHFLYAGAGYGGSCFPKDVQALQRTAEQNGAQLRILKAVEEANEAQKQRAAGKGHGAFRRAISTGRRFALWGLAFKPNTDDMREAPSRVVIDGVLARGASVMRLRSGRDGGGAAHLSRTSRACRFADVAAGGARWRRRADHRHRVEGVSQPGFRRHEAAPQAAADFRRPQPVRSGRGAGSRTRVLLDRPSVTEDEGVTGEAEAS